MKFKNPIKELTRFELCLWLISVLVILISFAFVAEKNYLTLLTSLLGATALIFLAKGFVFGQVLILIFSLLYGIISLGFSYYGEMITYLGMAAPIAVFSIVSWLKHPYKKTREVKVADVSLKQVIFMMLLTCAVTVAFYFLLKLLNNSNLIISTISVSTSFLAAYLSLLRSPFYALGYAANDVVLIVLWVLASIENLIYLPMIVCFIVFLVNDMYGFFNWRRMHKRQKMNK